MSWFYIQFDINWVRCANYMCRAEFTRVSVKGKRKCPKCKLDNKHCLPVKRELKK